MLYIDPTCYASRRSPQELELMATAGIVGLVEPTVWFGATRRSADSFLDDAERLTGPEARRVLQFGIGYGVCLGVTPQEANLYPVAQNVVEALPQLLTHDRVLAIGEIGLERGTGMEEEIFRRQIRLARHLGLPLVVGLPTRDRRDATIRTLSLLSDEGYPAKTVLINGVTEETLPFVRDYGCWFGLTIDRTSHFAPERAVQVIQQHGLEGVMINSAAGRLLGDPLAVPRTAHLMLEAGFSYEQVEKITFHNPKWFFSQAKPLPLPQAYANQTSSRPRHEQYSATSRGETANGLKKPAMQAVR